MVTVLSVEPYKGKTVRITLSEGEPVFIDSGVAAEYGLDVLAKLPIDPKLAAAVDAGKIEDAKLPESLKGALKTVEGLR